MIDFIYSFVFFIKNPYYENSKNLKLKINYLILLFIFIIILNLFLSSLTKGVFKFLNFPLYHKHLSYLMEVKTNYYYVFLKIVIISPILEEFFFRSVLKPKKIFLSLFLFSLFIFIFRIFEYKWIVSCLVSATLIILISFYLLKFEINRNVLNMYFKNYRLIVYVSSILFGLIHILNYNLTLPIILLSPIFFLPQIIAGFAYAFIRTKFGLILSIFSHSFYNLSLYMLLIFFSNLS